MKDRAAALALASMKYRLLSRLSQLAPPSYLLVHSQTARSLISLIWENQDFQDFGDQNRNYMEVGSDPERLAIEPSSAGRNLKLEGTSMPSSIQSALEQVPVKVWRRGIRLASHSLHLPPLECPHKQDGPIGSNAGDGAASSDKGSLAEVLFVSVDVHSRSTVT